MVRELKIANKLITSDGGIPYLYVDHFIGIYTSMVENYKCKPKESISAIKMTLEDHFWEGIEPDWASLEAYEWWDNLNPDYIESYIKAYPRDCVEHRWVEQFKPPSPLVEV
jgi:hypothetical protein